MIGSPFSFKTSFSCDNDSISGLYQFGDSQSDGWAGPLDFFEPWAGYAVYNDSEDIDSLVRVATNIEGNSICGLGDAAAWPVQSYINKFRHEFVYMIENGGKSIVDQ